MVLNNHTAVSSQSSGTHILFSSTLLCNKHIVSDYLLLANHLYRLPCDHYKFCNGGELPNQTHTHLFNSVVLTDVKYHAAVFSAYGVLSDKDVSWQPGSGHR
ncbi:transmembrane emp24 domain-containing protein 6 [Platysternon megacephalum]|uniref:Transmembrane emp24 domain-containing protein 6 n=1 Tax=Platysternon megacephalum TaxID=55544 RepID=A0A4D9EB59_9SAUR|nr:transmembrane emp24 domain-containing protein 6 [Platysternon megacephalum]